MLNILEIKATDTDFISQGRKDPVTGELLKNGDKVVLCKECGSAFLVDSWYYLDQTHCNQSDTYAVLPQTKNLSLKLEDGTLLYPKDMSLVHQFSKVNEGVIISILTILLIFIFLFFNAGSSLPYFLSSRLSVLIFILIFIYYRSTDKFIYQLKNKIKDMLPKTIMEKFASSIFSPKYYFINSNKLIRDYGSRRIDEIRWSDIEKVVVRIRPFFSNTKLIIYQKDKKIKKIKPYVIDYNDFKRMMYNLADLSHSHCIEVNVSYNKEAEDYITYLRNFRKAKFKKV